MAEHKKMVKSNDFNNRITMHVQKTAHTINWQKQGFLGGRTTGEEEGFLKKPLRSTREDR